MERSKHRSHSLNVESVGMRVIVHVCVYLTRVTFKLALLVQVLHVTAERMYVNTLSKWAIQCKFHWNDENNMFRIPQTILVCTNASQVFWHVGILGSLL